MLNSNSATKHVTLLYFIKFDYFPFYPLIGFPAGKQNFRSRGKVRFRKIMLILIKQFNKYRIEQSILIIIVRNFTFHQKNFFLNSKNFLYCVCIVSSEKNLYKNRTRITQEFHIFIINKCRNINIDNFNVVFNFP